MRQPRPTRRSLLLLATLLIAWSGSASARMYQWVDAQSGTVQLSGSPPAWYRGTQAGPRVFVFENGRLVDDTARRLPAEEAAMLRAVAFGAPASASPVLSAPLFDAPAPSSLPPGEALTLPTTAAAPSPEDSTSRQIAEFKALLEAYDRAQDEAAHDALDAAAVTPLAP